METRIDATRPQAGAAIDHLGTAIDAVGGGGFDTALATLLLDRLGAGAFVVAAAPGSRGAVEVLGSGGQAPLPPGWAEAFCDGCLAKAVADGHPDATNARSLRPEDIRSPALRRACFTGARLSGAQIYVRSFGGDTILLAVLDREGATCASARRGGEIETLVRALLPVVHLHRRLDRQVGARDRAGAPEMEGRIASTFPDLTTREVAVCARSVLGVTAEGIAIDLGIKQTSVLTYRRRAYTRLNINSINQLSTMLIQSSGTGVPALA